MKELGSRVVPEALGGGLGNIVASRGAPRVFQGRPEPKKLPKVGSFRVCSPFRGPPTIVNFQYVFSICVVFCCGCFSEAVFEGLRAQFLEHLGMISVLFFGRCWVWLGSKDNIVVYCCLQCFVNINLFNKTEELYKYSYVWVCFSGGPSASFFMTLGYIFNPF